MKPPKTRTYSEKLVTSTGCPTASSSYKAPATGPLSAVPMKAPVDVPTPSMGLIPPETSSTNTFGDKYSGISLAPLREPGHCARVRLVLLDYHHVSAAQMEQYCGRLHVRRVHIRPSSRRNLQSL